VFSCSKPKLPLIVAIASLPALATHASASDQQEPNCGQAVLQETVRETVTQIPLAGALIIASWQGGNDRTVKARTDSAGNVSICAPPDRLITLRASYRNIGTQAQTALLTLARPTRQVIAVAVPLVLVRGVIVDDATGAPIPNVSLRVANMPLAVVSDTTGHFSFAQVPLGDYIMHVEHIAYASYDATLAVRSEDLNAEIRLLPTAIALQPLTVTAFSRQLERSGFYDRKHRGIGIFLMGAQLEKLKGQFGSDLLRNVPSMLQVPQPSRRNAPRNYTMGRGSCRYQFIVDGTRTLADFEMDNISPATVEGLEIYNGLSEIPALFRPVVDSGSGTCGLIAVWTKAGR
jgi:hypothetical protein